jgi:DNA-binding protein Fis
MDPLKLPLEELLYLRLGQFFDQLEDRRVPGLYRVLMEQVDRAILRQALERFEGQLGAAAEFLDVDRNTLSRKARKLKLEANGKPAGGAKKQAKERPAKR